MLRKWQLFFGQESGAGSSIKPAIGKDWKSVGPRFRQADERFFKNR